MAGAWSHASAPYSPELTPLFASPIPLRLAQLVDCPPAKPRGIPNGGFDADHIKVHLPLYLEATIEYIWIIAPKWRTLRWGEWPVGGTLEAMKRRARGVP
jgi:hypothetical protein